ncbi:MAG: hypothetical protein J6A25_08920, partial [Lachnospiraceae bacterium]|nr:hypothetical protein [Lachnospiraceae bacterium]
MNFKILKRSLKSKKTINFILLVFIMLAAMFIAGSVNNLILITGGMDSYFEKACVDDYVIVGSIGGSRDNPLDAHLMLDEYLSNNEFVDAYTVDDIVFGGSALMKKEDGTELTLNGTVLISSFDSKQQKFFDQNNKEITQVEDGYIYITRREFDENECEIGDIICFNMSDGSVMKLTIAGISKDACFGADMMGSHRFIISPNDMDKLLSDEGFIYSRIYSIELNDMDGFIDAYSKEDIPMVFGDSIDTFKITYIMDMIIA